MAARKTPRKLAPLSSDDVSPSVMYRVRNPDPTKRYGWAALNSTDATQKEAMGWEPVLWSADPNAPTVFATGGKQGAPGTPIIRGEVILMCIDRAIAESRDETGLALIAERKARIGSRKRAALTMLEPQLRGGEHFSVTSETGKETTELAL